MKAYRFLLFICLMTLLTLPAFASDFSIQTDKETAAPGDVVTVTISSPSPSSDIAVGTILIRPSEGLEFVSHELVGSLSTSSKVRLVAPAYGINAGMYGVSFLSPTDIAIPAETFYQAAFRIAEDTVDMVSLQIYPYDVIDEAYQTVSVTLNAQAGPISITLPVVEFEEVLEEFTDGVKLNAKSLTLSGNIGVNFKMTVPEEYVANSSMTFTVKGRSETVRTSGLVPDGKGQYVFTCGVTSIEMAETIHGVFHYGEHAAAVEYSVADYIDAYETVSENYPAEITSLVHALADYGHHAQVFLSNYRNWSVGKDYAEMAGFTPSYTAEEIAAVQTAVQNYALDYSTNTDIDKINLSLNLESELTVYVYVTPVSGYTGTVSCTEGYSVERVGNRYRIAVPNIMAHQIGATHTLHLTTASGTTAVSVSALSYLNSLFNSETMNTVEGNKYFAVALYNYYTKALAVLQQ